MDFKADFTAARKAAGLTIKDVAELLGAPLPTVRDWSARNRTPPDWCCVLILDRILSPKSWQEFSYDLGRKLQKLRSDG